MKKYFIFDCETGGTDPGNTLLTMYGMMLDNNFTTTDVLDLKIKPNDGVYNVSPQALEINKIDLIKHDKEAITENEAARIFNDFSCRHAFGGKIIPIGHNVSFDIGFVKRHLLKNNDLETNIWPKYYSHRVLDTATIAHFLILAGAMPANMSCSLGSLAKYFGLDYSNAHDAEFDVKLTLEVLRKLLAKGDNLLDQKEEK